MKIGFDAKRAFWNQTGLGNYSRFILRGLTEFFPNEHYFYYTPNLADKKTPDFYVPSPHVHPVDLGKGWRGSFSRVMGMSSHFKKDELDIFHGLSNELPLFTGSKKTKQLVSVHDLLFLRYPAFYPALDRTIYKAKTLRACQRADLILAISQQTKEDLVTFLGVPDGKIQVHYQACHDQFKAPLSINELPDIRAKYGLKKPYILQVGTLEERKNALFTLQAYASNQKILSEFDLVLLGNTTPYCDKLNQFVEAQQLSQQVHFLHRSDFRDFPLLYKGASLSVYPSLFEGFGIPILEAITVGVPVITSKGGCFHEVGGDAALYVEATSVEEFSFAMERVLFDEVYKEQMIQRGHRQAERFSTSRLISELHSHYSKLLESLVI
jgi:glycosyltransferase involved in cell wall biosynthesis